MAPRFMQRLERQAQVYREVFGEPNHDPPPYPFSRSSSSASNDNLKSATTSQTTLPKYSQVSRSSPERSQYLPGPADAIIPKDALILVTAANSYQGMHIVDQLLAHGYRVRGTVRDAAKAVWTSKHYRDKYGPGRYTTAVIPDMIPRDAYDLAVRNCVGVIHCASVTALSADPAKVIAPSIAGALNALGSAARETGVKRFVLCSAATAAVDSGSSMKPIDVTSTSWNMECFYTAWNGSPKHESDMERAWAVQCAAKMQTEQAAWRWYREQRPSFVFNTVLPGMLWGTILSPEQTLPTSVSLLRTIFDGDAPATAWSPPQHFVNPLDSALLHLAALLLPDVCHRRLFAMSSPYNINGIVAALRRLHPNRVLPGDVSDHGVDLSFFRERHEAEALLQRMGQSQGFVDLEESLRECCQGWV